MPKLPSISSRKFRAVLERIGCRLDRIDGDHYVYMRAGLIRPVVVPVRKDLPMYIVLNNLRTLGLARKEFIKLLNEV